MADKQQTGRRRRKPESVRERAQKAEAAKGRQPRRRKLSRAASKPAGRIRNWLGTYIATHEHDESSRLKNFLTKPRSPVPSYISGAFNEIRLVTWPTFKEAMRLTLAVFVFAIAIAMLVSALDWVLDKAFQEIILNESQNIKEFFN